MASVEPYETKKGTRYLVRYRSPDRKQMMKRGFTRKKDALKYGNDIENAKLDGSFINPQAGKATLASIYELWEPGQKALAPSTQKTNKSAYNKHIKPKWGNWPVNRISAPDVRSWVADMADSGLKRDTILRAIHVLRALLDTAVEAKKISVNPAQKIKAPQEVKERRAYLTVPQINALADAMPSMNDKTMIYTLAYCGMRINELAALDVSDYMPRNRRLSITKAVKDYGGVIGATKTYETRSTPIPSFLVPMIEELIAGRPLDAPLFTSPEGLRIDAGNFRSRSFKPTLEEVIKDWKGENPFPNVKIHGLRHTCASLAISVGANVKAVQSMLGHKSASVTLDIYSDLFPDDLNNVADALNDLFTQAR